MGSRERQGCAGSSAGNNVGPIIHSSEATWLPGLPLVWHSPDTAATVCPAMGWGTWAQGPLCGLSGDLHPTLNNRAESESRAGAGPRVVCCERPPVSR